MFLVVVLADTAHIGLLDLFGSMLWKRRTIPPRAGRDGRTIQEPDGFPLSQYGIFPLFGPKIPAVAADGLFLPSEQFRRHCHIVDVGGSDFQGMHQPSVLVNTDVCLIAEALIVPLFRLMCLRVTLLFRIFGA